LIMELPVLAQSSFRPTVNMYNPYGGKMIPIHLWTGVK